MIYPKKKCFQALITLLSLSVLLSACTSNEPLRSEVQAFREQMLSDFNRLQSRLIPALEKDEPVTAAGEAIEKFLKELKDNDRKIFGIGLLDTKGEYLTGFVVEDITTGKLIKDKYKDMNFHSFKVVGQIVNSRKIMQEQLFLQDARILAIGFPVVNKDELLGILCFTFKSHELGQKWSISEEEFLQIDFGKV